MIAGGGGGGLTVQQPENNIARGAYYALASALSGTQTMALCSYDEAHTIPSEHAARLSLRTMQILMHEVGVCDTVDPLAGSYFIETTTNEMEQSIVQIMDELESRGGIIEGVAEGWVQRDVNRQAYELEKRVRSGEVRKVGVNCFEEEDEEPEVEFHPYRELEANKQVERLQRIRSERDETSTHKALEKVGAVARAENNVMPAIMDAVEAQATVGRSAQH